MALVVLKPAERVLSKPEGLLIDTSCSDSRDLWSLRPPVGVLGDICLCKSYSASTK